MLSFSSCVTPISNRFFFFLCDGMTHHKRSDKTSKKTKSTQKAHKKHPKRKTSRDSKLYIQDIMRSEDFTPSVRASCKRSAFSSRGSSFSAETPKEKAVPCAHGLRLGRTGKYVYASVPQFKRSVHRPRGYKSFVWKKVYDRKTKKPFDVLKFLKSRGVTSFYRRLIS